MADCRRCTTPTPGTALLCDQCTDQLHRALGDIAALTANLAVTTARQDVIGDTGTVKSKDPDYERWPVTCKPQALPFHWDAADMTWALGNTLTTWARVLLEHVELLHGPACPDCLHPSCNRRRTQQPPNSEPATVAAWLACRLDTIAHHDAAEQIHDEITACVHAVERTIDRPREQWYAGPCGGTTDEADGEPCDVELYATPGAETVHCRSCGATYDVADRRAWLLREAEDALAHAELIAKAATSLGEPITAAMVRGYAYRNRIWSKTMDTQGRPLYRVGDVLEVMRESLKRKAERGGSKPGRQAVA